jgi:hypothetical protein
VPDVHVIGDASIAGGLPKSASAANAEAKACAAAITSLLSGNSPPAANLVGACYNTVAPGYAFSLSGIYQPRDGMFAEIEGRTSPVDAPSDVRRREAEIAQSWYHSITAETFG